MADKQQVTADNLTDEQIREMRASVTDAANGTPSSATSAAARMWHDCNRALGQGGYERTDEPRQRIADVINARAKAGAQ